MTIEETLSRRERKKIETRQRLIEVALVLFLDQGYEETTVEQVADAADVAKGTFFNYFETKEAILPAMAEWRMEEIRARVSTSGRPTSPVARIKLLLQTVAEDPISDPRLTHHLVAAGPHPHAEPVRAFARLLTDLVAHGQAEGEIRDDVQPLQAGALLRAGFFQQMIMWHCGHRSAPLAEQLDSMVELLMQGIAARVDGRAR